MAETNSFILGFDPGGMSGGGSFGWSICSEVDGILQPRPRTGLATDAQDAIDKVNGALKSPDFPAKPNVLAAGIDAPLFWNRRGIREIDYELDRAMRFTGFPPPKNGGLIVQTVNQLRGACVIQGPLLAKYLHEEWTGLPITESHPKVLQWLLPLLGQSDTARMVRRLIAGLVEHELDATWCAVAAWGMMHHHDYNLHNWYDLYEWEMLESGRVEQLEGGVSYWMPIPEDLWAAG